MEKENYVASIDQSTTSTKFSVFRTNGSLVEQTILEHKQIVPKQGWLEHDPMEIIANVHQAAEQTLAKMSKNGLSLESIKGIGVTNQRETIVAWDSQTGKPLYNAIVWCDSRTVDIADTFAKKHGDMKSRVGLVASSYFSLFKILWLIENVADVKQKLSQKKIRFGNIDTWVVYNLTGQYVTDASNASRTFLYNLKGHWDEELFGLAGLPIECMPKVVGSFENVGTIVSGALKDLKIPVCSILGDQQSSAYALNLQQGEIKCTYGTGCFIMMGVGSKPHIFKDFITTIMYRNGNDIEYGIEASIESGAGTLNWLKTIGFFEKYEDLNSLQENGGVVFYPTFGRIMSPFWQNNMTGGFIGLSLFTDKQHMLRAVLQSIAFRVYDNLRSEELPKINSFKADGGITNNPAVMQLQADLLGQNVTVCGLDTCWGVAKGVMKSLGLDRSITEIESKVKEYNPCEANKEIAQKAYKKWSASKPRFALWNQ